MEEPNLDDLHEVLKLFLESDVRDLHLEIAGVTMAVSRGEGGIQTLTTHRGTGDQLSTDARQALASAADQGADDVGPAAAQANQAAQSPTAAARSTTSTDTTPASVEGSREGLTPVSAPVLGVFYRRPSPDQSPFVEVGDIVGPDDTVCIVDVMKLFNHVPAGSAGRIAEICVEDGQMVEFGQTLMWIEPNA